MRIKIEYTVSGKKIEIYTPENEADQEEIRRMAEKGEIDDHLAFSDYPPEVRERQANKP